jgi:hypothetical protein
MVMEMFVAGRGAAVMALTEMLLLRSKPMPQLGLFFSVFNSHLKRLATMLFCQSSYRLFS